MTFLQCRREQIQSYTGSKKVMTYFKNGKIYIHIYMYINIRGNLVQMLCHLNWPFRPRELVRGSDIGLAGWGITVFVFLRQDAGLKKPLLNRLKTRADWSTCWERKAWRVNGNRSKVKKNRLFILEILVTWKDLLGIKPLCNILFSY